MISPARFRSLAGASAEKKDFKIQALPQQHLCTSIVSTQHTQRWHTHPEVDAGEEIAGDAAELVAEEVVTEEGEEDFQEAVVEVSFRSPRSSDSQEIEILGREIPYLRLRKSYETKRS